MCFGPMPDTMRSWGDWKVPAEMMTSFRALSVYEAPFTPETPSGATRTPVAVVLSKRIFWASVLLYTMRVVFCSANCKKLLSEDDLVAVVGSMVDGT